MIFGEEAFSLGEQPLLQITHVLHTKSLSFRLLEVNGKTVLNKSLDDLNRLLSAAPDPAQIVVLREEQPKISMADSKPNHRCHPSNNTGVNEVTVLRKELEVVREQAEEAQRTKDDLKADNVRLTHRISYLEEQV